MLGPVWRIVALGLLLQGVGGCGIYHTLVHDIYHTLHDPPEATTYRGPESFYCQLHDRRMKVGLVNIVYGEVKTSKAERELHITTFPNANTYVWARYNFLYDPPRYAWTWYCPDCRKTMAQWEKQTSAEAKARLKQPPPQEVFPEKVEYLIGFTASQTDDESIERCLDELRKRMCDQDKPDAARLASNAYVRAMHRLEDGWPGFSGEIVGLHGREPVHRTEKDVLSRQYCVFSFEIGDKDPKLRGAIYPQLYPEDPKLRKDWLHWAIIYAPFNSHPFTTDTDIQTVAGKDPKGRDYMETWGLADHFPGRLSVRRIDMTGPDGKPLTFYTFVTDAKLAPASDIIERYFAEMKGKDPNSFEFLLNPIWVNR